jgi:hypothetical protein
LGPQAHEREGDTTIVSQFPVELQRLPVQRGGVVEIGAIIRERACLAQELRPRGRLGDRVGAIALAQRRLEPPAPLREGRAYFPEACGLRRAPRGGYSTGTIGNEGTLCRYFRSSSGVTSSATEQRLPTRLESFEPALRHTARCRSRRTDKRLPNTLLQSFRKAKKEEGGRRCMR